jgi:hypothetical protein
LSFITFKNIIAFAQIIAGIILAYYSFILLDLTYQVLKNHGATWHNVLFVAVFRQNHFLPFISCLLIVSGSALILNKKFGWILSIIIDAAISIIFVILLFTNENFYPSRDVNNFIYCILIIMTSFVCTTWLTIKYFNNKDYLNIKTLTIISLFITMIVIDKFYLSI